MFVFSLVIKVLCIRQRPLIKLPSFSAHPQDSDGDKSEDNLVVDVSNEVSLATALRLIHKSSSPERLLPKAMRVADSCVARKLTCVLVVLLGCALDQLQADEQ